MSWTHWLASGILQVSGYKGFMPSLYAAWEHELVLPVYGEASCWAHCAVLPRLSGHDPKSEIAREALDRCRQTSDVDARYVSASLLTSVYAASFKKSACPRLKAFLLGLEQALEAIPGKSILGQWPSASCAQPSEALACSWKTVAGGPYPDNNPAERALRPLKIGRKNWLVFGRGRPGARTSQRANDVSLNPQRLKRASPTGLSR